MNQLELFKQEVEATGIFKCAWTDIEKVVFDPVFREMCVQNSCGLYGKCYMCPPDVGDIHEMIAEAKTYNKGLLYQTVASIEDSFDFEGMTEAKRAHNAVAQQIHKIIQRVLPEAKCLHMAAGGCGVCARCAKLDHLPCYFPEKALPSLESYGVDVYHTAENAGLRYVNGPNTVTYFGMVLMRENENA